MLRGDAIAKALKPVYTAPTVAAAEQRFLEFAEEWGDRYPAIVRLWENAWAEFVPFLAFDAEIRKVVCSTNVGIRERPDPPGRASPWTLPERASRSEMYLPRRHGPRPPPAPAPAAAAGRN